MTSTLRTKSDSTNEPSQDEEVDSLKVDKSIIFLCFFVKTQKKFSSVKSVRTCLHKLIGCVCKVMKIKNKQFIYFVGKMVKCHIQNHILFKIPV